MTLPTFSIFYYGISNYFSYGTSWYTGAILYRFAFDRFGREGEIDKFQSLNLASVIASKG